MTPLYNISAIRAIEREQFAAMPSFTLMQQAGSAVAAAAQNLSQPAAAEPILALAGNGNNGGDAIVAATELRQAGYNARLVFCGNPEALPEDAARALKAWQTAGYEILTAAHISDSSGALCLPPAQLLIDGIFGIGLSRPPHGIWRQLIDATNCHPAPVLAIDVASGLDADSGCDIGVRGEKVANAANAATAIRAAKTVTFFGGKPGLYTGDGIELSGEVEIAPLTLPAELPAPCGWLMKAAPPLTRLRRSKNSHKGSYGTVALAGGADGMLGALVLAARATARLGAGKTIACALGSCPPVDWQHPDIMWRNIADIPFDSATCFAVGMGLGTSAMAAEQLARLLTVPAPLLVDADGLTLLAQDSSQRRQVAARQHGTIFTPHPGEAARLLDSDYAAIAADRCAAAAAIARDWRTTVVLKGAGSIIQTPEQPFIICGAGNPGLARGGSGDILSGMITALLAQTEDTAFATATGTWLHAAAADRLAQQNGALGVNINQLADTATELVRDALASGTTDSSMR